MIIRGGLSWACEKRATRLPRLHSGRNDAALLTAISHFLIPPRCCAYVEHDIRPHATGPCSSGDFPVLPPAESTMIRGNPPGEAWLIKLQDNPFLRLTIWF